MMNSYHSNAFVETLAEGLRAIGFTAELKQDITRPGYLEALTCLEATIETGLGQMQVHATCDGMRMGKPNGSSKFYWGTVKQCLAVIRQTLRCYQ